MNALNGTTRMVYEDARWLMGKFLLLFITVPIMAAWIVLGLFVDLGGADVVSAISGPAYFFIPTFAIMGFKSLFPVVIGMGSTRKQFLKSFYSVGVTAVVVSLLFVNVGHYVLIRMNHNILHPGAFFEVDYHFLVYLFIDIMVGLFLFGIAFLTYSIWHRLGLIRSAMILMAVAITGMFLYYGGSLDSMFSWIGTLDFDAMIIGNIVNLGTIAIILLGVLGLIALFITYPLMRNASLQPKPRK
jgi:hypothetical protein